tara:strand:- start:505 stop:1590 length:1086 start_codon:yes stop_codon:yes gene_type:complete
MEKRKKEKARYQKYVITDDNFMNNPKFVQLELMKLKMDIMGVNKKLKSGNFANVKNKKELVNNETVESIKKEIEEMRKDAKKINDEQMKNGQKMEETEKIINKNVQTTNEELFKTINEKVEESKTELSKKIDNINNRLMKIDDEIVQMKTQNSRFNKAILKINELFENFSEIQTKYDGFRNIINQHTNQINSMNEEISRNKVVDDDLSDVDISEFKRIVHIHSEEFVKMRDDFNESVKKNDGMKHEFQNITKLIKEKMSNFEIGIKNVSDNYYFIENNIKKNSKELNNVFIKFNELQGETNELRNTVEYRIALIDGKKPNNKVETNENKKEQPRKVPLVGLPLARILESRKFKAMANASSK